MTYTAAVGWLDSWVQSTFGNASLAGDGATSRCGCVMDLENVRPAWLKNVFEVGGAWLKWFGYWAFFDLTLHVIGQYLGWSVFGKPRTPGEALFYDSWMASWFLLISSAGRRKLGVLLGSLRFRAKKSV